MFKLDKIKSLFDCDFCSNLLVDPISLPCGDICKSHINNLLRNTTNDKNFFKCKCQEEHYIPKRGFMINRRIQKALDIELSTLKITPLYDECKKVIEEARKNLTKIETLEQNSECYIYDYFSEIKRLVDLRREDLKVKIDKYSEDVIQLIDCLQLNLKENNQISTTIGKAKMELYEVIRQFDTLEISDKKFETIKNSVSALNKEFELTIATYNDSLIGNSKYSFVFDEQPASTIFGTLIEFGSNIFSNIQSNILEANLKVELAEICKFPVDQNWKLLYRASRDGFSAKAFHEKCDRFEGTLTVIKSTSGEIFGGFTEKAWQSNSQNFSSGYSDYGYVPDPNAFIFSLANKNNKPFKAISNGTSGIYCYSFYGPSFGCYNNSTGTTYYDLYISSNSNANLASYSDLGYGYKNTGYQVGTEKAKTILAGSYYFQTDEIEVFTKTH